MLSQLNFNSLILGFSFVEFIATILMWGGGLGMVIGYGLMGGGISEMWGIPVGLLAGFTVVLMPIFVFFGIWYNQKMQTGALTFVVCFFIFLAGIFIYPF